MARPKTEAAEFVAFPIRLPRELLELIKEQAYEVGRPVNTQIIRMLESDMQRIHEELDDLDKRRLLAGAL